MPQFAPTEPYASGMLDVGDGHRLWWAASGNPNGKAAVVLHGGPGGGSWPNARRMFDPALYNVIQFDQRNCGLSTPHASDPSVDLATNTTAHLIDDCERLREHLGIQRWLVWGGSWGTTLALAYSQAFPERVTEMILVSVVTTTAAEVQWVTHAMGRVFPQQWAKFRDGVPEPERDGNLAAAYDRLLNSADAQTRERAAIDWCAWEDTHVATHPGAGHDERYDDPVFRMCFARLVCHYWSNAAFLEDGQLMREMDRLADIPAVLIHGRLDISGPPDIAWQLAQRWPNAELVLVEDAGHGASNQTVKDAIVRATNRFALTV
jgi:proline iminopeptidase